MKRHLHFVQSIEPLEGGGLGRAALELSNALRLAGHPSSLVTTTGGEDDAGDWGQSYARRGPTKIFYASGLHRLGPTLIDAADVVHGHGFYVGPNFILGREARRQKRPLVYHAHGIFEPWILARSRLKKRLVHWLFEDANFRHAALWRALTDKEAAQIRAQGITAPIIVCPNGIDLGVFADLAERKARLESAKQRRELLFLARLHPKKGLPMLVEAWARQPDYLRSSWRVVIAGPDEAGHRGEVEALIKSAGLVRDFVFTGTVSGAAKLDALASADAFVLPSHSEGFSVAILEAMACSLPVLATTACNFPALATNGGGWSVAPDVESLSVALGELLASDTRALSQRGESARTLVERCYTWPKIAGELAAASEDLK